MANIFCTYCLISFSLSTQIRVFIKLFKSYWYVKACILLDSDCGWSLNFKLFFFYISIGSTIDAYTFWDWVSCLFFLSLSLAIFSVIFFFYLISFSFVPTTCMDFFFNCFASKFFSFNFSLLFGSQSPMSFYYANMWWRWWWCDRLFWLGLSISECWIFCQDKRTRCFVAVASPIIYIFFSSLLHSFVVIRYFVVEIDLFNRDCIGFIPHIFPIGYPSLFYPYGFVSFYPLANGLMLKMYNIVAKWVRERERIWNRSASVIIV